MRVLAVISRAFAIALASLGVLAAVSAPLAQASTGDIIAPSDPDAPTVNSGWQAGTCIKEPPDPGASTCSVATPTQFFEQAAGHPNYGFTQFIVKFEPGTLGPKQPVGELKNVLVDLPVGLTVNPQATPQCKQEDFEKQPLPLCPANSEVGKSFITGSADGLEITPPLEATVYNIIPPEGEPARFGFNLAGNNVYLQAGVAWESDYHEYFAIEVPEAPKLPPILEGLILKNRLVFRGTDGDGTFITTPGTCLGQAVPSPFQGIYSTWLRASSIEEEEDPSYEFPTSASPRFESRIPPGTSPKHCDTIPFDPGIAVDPNTTQTDSPSGATVNVTLPEIQDPGKEEKQASSHVRSAKVTMPAGMGLNPSAANGLEACTDAQFNKGSRADVACPAASKVGTVEVETPPLPEGSLTGSVFVGKQLSSDPASGNLYRIFLTAESERFGISARLLGKVSADPQTGRLTTTLDDGPLGSVPIPGLPQVPFESFRIKFNGGARAPLTSPPVCGPHATTTLMTPWSSAVGLVPPGSEEGPSGAPPASRSADFSLGALPGGGACPATLAARPFSPGFDSRTDGQQAGAFSSLRTVLTRADGNQELKGATVDLPRGLSAKLAGVTYCPEAGLAAAAANSGLAERATPSCPDSSSIGSVSLASGTGPDPLKIEGRAYLAGPYKGAPLSMAVITPAVGGPFDVGTVVTRIALFVDRATAAVRAVSDPIPHVYGGALLDVRSVSLSVDRKEFTFNPTNCAPMAIGGTLNGGGADPSNPAAFSTLAVSTPFQAKDCNKLGFKPKLRLRLFGATKRAQHPRLRAVLRPRKGDANIARASVGLPHAIFLDQGSLSSVCTRKQFDESACPKGSRYGYARAFTPLLDKPLRGPVYLRSSSNPLPDMVADLRGQVNIELVGRVDTVRGGIRTTFDVVPDVPTSKFVLTLPGGKHGLLVASRNLCAKPVRAVVRFKGQNGKKANSRPKLRTPCGGKNRPGRR